MYFLNKLLNVYKSSGTKYWPVFLILDALLLGVIIWIVFF